MERKLLEGGISVNLTVSGVPIGADEPVTIHFEAGRILRVVRGGDSEMRLAPGLVDIHCHGGGGHEFGDGNAELAASFHHRAGTTSVVASLLAAEKDALIERTNRLRRHVGDRTLAGIHLEGPFLSPTYRGAQDPTALSPPDWKTFEAITATPIRPMMMTIAPDVIDPEQAARALAGKGIVMALGHTGANARQMLTALEIAASFGMIPVVTHLYNGMPPIHHRNPGPAMASLEAASASRAWIELIADGVHVDADMLRSTISLVGRAVVLVSDATAATGLGDGEFSLGSASTIVRGRTSTLASDGSIAGSVIPLFQGVQYAIESGIPPAVAFAAATAHPARALGLREVGTLEPGNHGDVLVLSRDHELVEVWRSGRRLDS